MQSSTLPSDSSATSASGAGDVRTAQVGVVIIGRNEGERLRRCLASVRGHAGGVVYVDSGSTDGSVALAQSFGVAVVDLDLSIPFTAARARNEGFARLELAFPGVRFVQFVDGDCEMIDGWLERAAHELETRPEWAAVCGRLRERFPEASPYNRLCDMEWNTPVGEAAACGGIAMMRVEAVRQVGGFRDGLIAGEEPELCVRLRAQGWKIVRIDADMGWHDAAMTRFGQWWRRAVRGGHAYAEVSRLPAGPVRLWARECRSNWFWGLALPLLALVAAPFTVGLSLLLLLGYPVLAARIYRRRRRDGDRHADALRYAGFCVLGKFAHALGQLRYLRGRLLARPSTIIEYKTPAEQAS